MVYCVCLPQRRSSAARCSDRGRSFGAEDRASVDDDRIERVGEACRGQPDTPPSTLSHSVNAYVRLSELPLL